jgi:hypothetical protein
MTAHGLHWDRRAGGCQGADELKDARASRSTEVDARNGFEACQDPLIGPLSQKVEQSFSPSLPGTDLKISRPQETFVPASSTPITFTRLELIAGVYKDCHKLHNKKAIKDVTALNTHSAVVSSPLSFFAPLQLRRAWARPCSPSTLVATCLHQRSHLVKR